MEPIVNEGDQAQGAPNPEIKNENENENLGNGEENPTPPTPPTPPVDDADFKQENIKVGDKISFYPTGAEEPVIVVADKAFLALELSDEIIEKHKYAKV